VKSWKSISFCAKIKRVFYLRYNFENQKRRIRKEKNYESCSGYTEKGRGPSSEIRRNVDI
jgi:hypothetical protein